MMKLIEIQNYKTTGKKELFDEHETIEKLSSIGNPLERLSLVIDFEMFRTTLDNGMLNADKKSNAGAKPFDLVSYARNLQKMIINHFLKVVLKILIIQRYYGLADKQIEYQILNRLSLKKFLGLESSDKVPDEKTV
ncbi:MAG TPA: transposase [Edaphocola sp.]|nr:transposase [Edaphocola sp.]